jgi:hypothetical protein
MVEQYQENSYLDIFKNKLPTLIKDIEKGSIRKYTKHGIYEPDSEDMAFITKLKARAILKF